MGRRVSRRQPGEKKRGSPLEEEDEERRTVIWAPLQESTDAATAAWAPESGAARGTCIISGSSSSSSLSDGV